MYVKFDTPSKGASGKLNNTGSSAAFVSYMGKEDEQNKATDGKAQEWFSHRGDEHHPAAVRANIDKDHQGIGKNEGKFATGSINPTKEEWQALGKSETEREKKFKNWVQKEFTKELCDNYHKKDKQGNNIAIKPDNVKIYFKLEKDRHYTGMDEEVKQGKHKQGEQKEGFNIHCHFIVARKTEDGLNRISPTTNNSKEFNRVDFKNNVEKNFDKNMDYNRPLNQSFEYMNTMQNGKGAEKVAMIEKATEQEFNKTQEKQRLQPQVQEHVQEKKNDQEHEKDEGFSFSM